MSSDEQARALVDGDIDLGVARTVPVRPAVDSAVLGHDRFMLAVPADHAAAGQRTVSLRRLVRETFVGFSRTSSPSLHAELRSLLGGHGVGYDPAIEEPSTPRSSVWWQQGRSRSCLPACADFSSPTWPM